MARGFFASASGRTKKLFVSPTWRTKKTMFVLMAIEFPLVVAILTLFGIAHPNTYRTKLWQEGADLGYNSAPNVILYAMANYKPVKTPLVWSSHLTSFNLVISVLQTFILICKATMLFVNTFYPMLSLVVHCFLLALYSYSAHGQTGHDTLDPRRQSTGLPWYIKESCDIASTSSLKGYCLQAKSCFVVTVLVLYVPHQCASRVAPKAKPAYQHNPYSVLFCVYILLSCYSLIPTTAQREHYEAQQAEKRERKSAIAKLQAEIDAEAKAYAEEASHMSVEQYWAQQGQFPRSPGYPGAAPLSAGGLVAAPSSPYGQWAAHYGGPQSPVHYTEDGEVDWSKQQWEMHAYPQQQQQQQQQPQPQSYYPPVSPGGSTAAMKSPYYPPPEEQQQQQEHYQQQQQQQQQLPAMTPRTEAFQHLSGGGRGDLPLRQE
ncbi:uncharacterized protein BKA78DRAFT_139579 [Phyllosticta capitalensis]|uniref:uncharacterized protein n=1 Tax=Phyllosticta capitalensis TaxID=121624 RepID=UPI0031315E7B